MEILGNIIDCKQRRIYLGKITITDGVIQNLQYIGAEDARHPFIAPGFVDAHVHIESSMLPPAEFARYAVVHGTVACVSDPHEIANVLGLEGVRYMIAEAKTTPLKICFGAPSCVPATTFETSGATLSLDDIRVLFEEDGLTYLSEMMNYPGVVYRDSVVMDKIALAHRLGKTVDGHAPGLMGKDLQQYVSAGISTDHECFSLEEALAKIELGMNIIIREGSAAKNYHALHSLLQSHPQKVMFCSDDKHPDDLLRHHINELVRRSLVLGYDIFDVFAAAGGNAVRHYNLPVGQLQVGDRADFIVLESLATCRVVETYITGICVARNGEPLLSYRKADIVNNYSARTIAPEEITVAYHGSKNTTTVRCIEALNGELITREKHVVLAVEQGIVHPDVENDILYIVVANRYQNVAGVATAFIHGFGLRKGAIASSVAHDSHNIVAVGTTSRSCAAAINAVLEQGGGIAFAPDDISECTVLPLPIAGLMSDAPATEVAEQYAILDTLAKKAGSTLAAPFMTLSFMALLVIPQLKLSDKGLFSSEGFNFVDIILPENL